MDLASIYIFIWELSCDYHVMCRAGVCIQCDALWTLMHSFSTGSGSLAISLPPQVQKNLMGSLVMCAIGERKKEFLTQVCISKGWEKESCLVLRWNFWCCHLEWNYNFSV